MWIAATLWIIGALYACGRHAALMEDIRDDLEGGMDLDLDLPETPWQAWVALFFGWPHYLGYWKREDLRDMERDRHPVVVVDRGVPEESIPAGVQVHKPEPEPEPEPKTW